MSHAPRHRRQRSAVSTPGDRSVASARSNRSTRSTSVRSVASAESESGVPWNIKKQLAQDIEDEFPLASGGIALLLNQPGQPLSRFLTERNKAHGEPICGKQGDEIRERLSDLAYRWKQKTCEEHDKYIIQKHKVIRRPGKPQARVRKAYGDSEDEASQDGGSSLSSAGSYEKATPQKPTPKTPTASKPPRSTSKRNSSKRNLVGKTIITTSPPTTPTTGNTDFSAYIPNFSVDSIHSMNACKPLSFL